MGQKEKRIKRLKETPKDYTYDEAKALLGCLDFDEFSKGSTSGSRVMFFRKSDKMKILLHKPHGPNMDVAAVKEILMLLMESGDIK